MADVDAAPAAPAESAWSVARLNEEIGAVLADARDRFPAYVVGEVSDVNAYDFGTFFDLRDLDGGETISCIAWAYRLDAVDHELEEGTETIVRANVDFYADDGRTQLDVKQFWPVGDSDRSRDLDRLREQLAEEGLFDGDRKQPLPPYPDHVGVVTSLAGSAREDFREAAWSRDPGIVITFCGATVQGDSAVPSLVAGIRTLERDPDVDVIVVTRGGGSDANLWSFNEEPVVRAIADCATPVVVAVGHEDDETLAEAVADRRAMTPTDAGVTVTPDVAAVREGVRLQERRIDRAYDDLVADRLSGLDRRVDAAKTALEHRVGTREAMRQRANDLEGRVATAYDALVDDRLTALDHRIDAAFRAVEHDAETDAVTARAARGRIGGLESRIDGAYRTHVEREVDALEARIDRAFRDLEADAKVAAGTREARRLRIAVLLLLVLLVAVVVYALLL